MADTVKQYREVVDSCRELFLRKLGDYSPSWSILRLTSVTDQVLNKAKRIRQIGESGVALVNEGVEPEFVGLVNYSIIGLIQLELGPTLEPDLTNEEAMTLYDKYAKFEADEMQFALTEDVMDLMTTIRAQWGLTYPEEEKN